MKQNEHAEALERLTGRLAALERHVFEQDKEMLALSRELERLRGGLVQLRETVADTGDGLVSANTSAAAPAPERPPHY